MSQRIMGLVGWKNTGKTTLMEKLIRELTSRGFTVSTVKHAHHDADIDQPGRDSHRHRTAGATESVLVTDKRWAIVHELREKPPLTLAQILKRMSATDLILIEGYKAEHHKMLEVHSTASGKRPLAADRDNIVALASDAPVEGVSVPVFSRDAIEEIADFILAEVGLTQEARHG